MLSVRGKGLEVKNSANWIVALLVGGAIGFVAGQAVNNKSGAPAQNQPVAQNQNTPPQPNTPRPPDNDYFQMPLGDSPVQGKPGARITLVELTDFQCPFCSRVVPTVKAIQQKYGDDVRLVVKMNPLPFHPNAMPAAKAALAAQKQGKFFEMYDLLFANQGQLSPESYDKWAQQIGLDMNKFHADLNDPALATRITEEQAQAQKVGLAGTPGFLINGKKLSGAQPQAEFEKIVDAEMAHAKQLEAQGIKSDAIYAEIQKTAKAAAPAPPPQQPNQAPPVAQVRKVDLPDNAEKVSRGAKNPKVTIVEFSDFQCPFCSRVEPTLKSVRDKYGDKVRLVWKNEPLPFHPAAGPAAEAAMEVRAEKGDKGFWDMHDRLYAAQKDLMSGKDPNIDAIVKIASDAGASADKVKAAISGQTHKKEIDADNDLSQDFQASGTPHFFVNGRRLVGAQPEEKFDKIIDEEIKKAQDLISKGTKPSEVYDALVKDGKGPPPPEMKDIPSSLPANDPARGNMNAKVTIHEWSDFQCPFCGRVEPAVQQVMKEYGDRIKFVWHDLPLPMHADAPLASEAGREAFKQKGPSAFWAIHDKMFTNQQHIKRDDLDGYAKELNLDMDKWKAALDGSTHSAEIEADKTAAGSDNISGTPAFLIAPNGAKQGYFISGAQDYGKFHKLIDRALAEAK